MKISISHKHVETNGAVEADTAHHVEKLERLLKTYEPDLVQLHGVFSRSDHTQDHTFSLNLSLPTGTLHATATADTARTACKAAFVELESQVKKHQSRLRHDHEWKRKNRAASTVRTAEAET
jgi:ribosomal subunit interface protein